MPRRPMSLGEALGGAVSRSGDRYQDYTIRKQATDRQGGLDSLDAAFRQAGLDQGQQGLDLGREQFEHRQHMDFTNQLKDAMKGRGSELDDINTIQELIARRMVSGELSTDDAVAMFKRFFPGSSSRSSSSTTSIPALAERFTFNPLKTETSAHTKAAQSFGRETQNQQLIDSYLKRDPDYTPLPPLSFEDWPGYSPPADTSAFVNRGLMAAGYMHGPSGQRSMMDYLTQGGLGGFFNPNQPSDTTGAELTPEEKQLLDQLRALEAQGQ